MPNPVAHFAIHADDCDRAKSFYESVFGWTFEPWGPPGFWRVHTTPEGISGALQQRRSAVSGDGMIGYECSISVEDVTACAKAIEEHGGTIESPPFTISNVGTVLYFRDPEGNRVGAMQYVDGLFDR